MKTDLPEDLVPKSFIDQFGSQIKCALGGWDRMRFHASLRPLFSPAWMSTYLCAAKVRLADFKAHATALTDRFLQEGKAIAEAAGRPHCYLRSSKTNKEELIEEIAQKEGTLHVCGELCAQKLQSQFMGNVRENMLRRGEG